MGSQFQMHKKLRITKVTWLMCTNTLILHMQISTQKLLSRKNPYKLKYTQLRVDSNLKLRLDHSNQYLLQLVIFLKLSLPKHIYLIEKYANAHSNTGLIP